MKQLKNLVVIMLALLTVVSCKQSEKNEGWTLNGKIEGFGDGKIILSVMTGIDREQKSYEVEVKADQFSISGPALDGPKIARFNCKGPTNAIIHFIIDNGITTYEGKMVEKEFEFNGVVTKRNEVEDISLKGSVEVEHYKKVKELMRPYENMTENAKIGSVEWTQLVEKKGRLIYDIKLDFVKKHPKALYSAILLEDLSRGENAKGMQELLDLVDPNLNSHHIQKMKEYIKNSLDVDISEVITASNVSYKVEKSYKGSSYLDIIYLGVMNNNNLCALAKDGMLNIIDPTGKKLNSFKPELKAVPSTMAIDASDNIYLMVPVQKEVTTKYRGRAMTNVETVGYKCHVIGKNGEPKKVLDLGALKYASGARIANNKLLVADLKSKIIAVFNLETGAREAALEGMRPCCGILDFSVNNKNEVLVANLGAFRVQAYDLSGKQLLAFGRRGKSLSDFHGCCNPVSVAYLSNGAIVTVEKDPTRVKVFSNEGAKQIEGIQELVEGCSYIPMIVDAKDNLYLASPKKGIVKCVSI
ncbi:hypothetical protein [Marinifilum sp.]|uniref:hypothetical protein n=1 Tax=Marinifilum sp. TaxID=2033137 RepID=UPI003BAD342B